MGGGGPSKTTSTVTQSNLPEYARPYYQSLMERGMAESERPYEAYQGQRLAGQDAATKAGLNAVTQYAGTNPSLLNSSTSLQNAVAQGALNAGNYQANGVTNAYTGPQQGNYQASNYAAQQLGFGQGGINQVNAQNIAAQNIAAQQMGFGQNGLDKVAAQQLGFGQNGLNQVNTGTFGADAAQQYMSPYMDAVVNRAQENAARNYEIEQSQRNLQAAKAGSFGGSRAAVQSQMAANALQNNLTDIFVTGQQSAFENAQSQFNTDQARALQAATQNQNTALQFGQANQQAALDAARANQNTALQFGQSNQQSALQAAQSNQQAGLTASQANQQAALEAARANQQAGLTMGQANQQAALNAAQLNEQSRQYGYGATEDAYRAAAEMGMNAQQATEQLRQSGAQLGLQGLELANQSAQNMADLQGQYDSRALQQAQALLGVGQTREDYLQQQLDQSYDDFVNQRDSERQNLQFLSSLLQGVPVSANQDVQSTQASGANNLTGALGSLGGLQALYALGRT